MDSNLPTLHSRTNNSIFSFNIEPEDLINIISKLNPNKASGFDGISVRMLKLCQNEVSIPLCMIFKACLARGIFPSMWKHANVQLVHKKSSRQLKSNYPPISLLPLCSKILFDVI